MSDVAAAESLATAGSGELSFRAHAGKTAAETCVARSPLKLLTPKNHGSFAWVFAANFGGGFVDGDAISLRLRLHEGAGALLGSQGATKIYRSPSGCRQRTSAAVAEDASLVVLPDPVSPFAGAEYTQETRIDLAATASLLLVDGVTCGRTAHGERWDLAHYSSKTEIVRDGALIFHDRTLLDPAHGLLRARLRRIEALTTIVAIGPRFAGVVAAMVGMTPSLVRRGEVLVSASALPRCHGDGAVVRIAATSVERAMAKVREALVDLPMILGDDPFARKW